MNITEALHQVLNQGGDNNFFVVQLDANFYIQVAGTKGSPDVMLEAISNEYLPKNRQLTKVQHDKLIALGWELPDGSNYTMDCSIRTSDEIERTAELIQLTASEVYNTKVITDQMLELSLDV
jgi:hypothetical protein